MKKKIIFACLLFLYTQVNAAYLPVSKSTQSEQTFVEVTVYSNNLALIREVRKVRLSSGEAELKFFDVAKLLKPETVHVASLSNPAEFSLLEQNFLYDIIDPDKLLDKYIGEKIKIVDFNQYQDRKETVEAVLLGNSEKGQVFKIGNDIYLGYPGYRVIPQAQTDMVSKPTLVWLYRNKAETAHDLEVSYLTQGISWDADYTLILDEDSSKSDLTAWASVTNESGADYEDAVLKLIAGEVNLKQVPAHDGMLYKAAALMEPEGGRGSGFRESKTFEYHLYELERKTSIYDRETKQVKLLEAQNIATAQEYITEDNQINYVMRSPVDKRRSPVDTYIKFKNSAANKLGMPLVAGTVRFYKTDKAKSLQFLGENNIPNTPRDEEVKIKAGAAFDLVAERKQTDYKRISNQMHESEWEITLKNRKDKNVVIGVKERLTGNWEIVEKTQNFKKLDAYIVQFDVNVPSGKEVVLRYRVRVGL